MQELGDGYYYYTVEAKWYTMPSNRNFDSIGACADESSIYHHSKTEYSLQPTLTLQNKSSSFAIAISENTTVAPVIAELDTPINYDPTP